MLDRILGESTSGVGWSYGMPTASSGNAPHSDYLLDALTGDDGELPEGVLSHLGSRQAHADDDSYQSAGMGNSWLGSADHSNT